MKKEAFPGAHVYESVKESLKGNEAKSYRTFTFIWWNEELIQGVTILHFPLVSSVIM